MGKIQLFAINFTNERQVYYPGEQLAGLVVLSLSQPMEARAIKMEFEGKGYCHWSETHGSGDDRRTEHYYGKEKIFEYKCIIYGQSGGGSRVVLPAGQTSYQFAFTVPNNIPSSFEGSIGHIRYEMKAEIDRPWKFDHKVKRPITINDIIDTNLPQYLIQPGGTEHKDVGCLCCAAGPLEMSAHIDRACYCPGEAIYITSDIQNNTTRDMEAVKGKLIQTIAYHASSKTKSHTNTMARIEGPALPRGQFAKWDNQPMAIPALPPSILNSRVVNISYHVEVEVAVPWGMDPDIKLPFTMGTIPYRPVYQQQAAPPQYNAGAPPMGMAPQNIFPDMPPPTYASATGEQAVNIADENDKHTKGNLSYMPVYTFAQPYQGPPPTAPVEHQLPPGFQPQLQSAPGGYPPAPAPQQPGGYPPAPAPQQPGGYPPAGPPGGYPPQGPPPQAAPGGYPPGPPQQPGYQQASPGGYPPGGYPPEQPITSQPGASSPYPPPGQQPPYNPETEAAPIPSKPPMV